MPRKRCLCCPDGTHPSHCSRRSSRKCHHPCPSHTTEADFRVFLSVVSLLFLNDQHHRHFRLASCFRYFLDNYNESRRHGKHFPRFWPNHSRRPNAAIHIELDSAKTNHMEDEGYKGRAEPCIFSKRNNVLHFQNICGWIALHIDRQYTATK